MVLFFFLLAHNPAFGFFFSTSSLALTLYDDVIRRVDLFRFVNLMADVF